MFDNLTDRLSNSFKALQGKNKLTEANIKEAIREVRRSLLEADVALDVIKFFIDRVQTKAVGLKVGEGLNPSQAFIKLVETELTEVIGGQNETLNLATQPPAVVMVAGLQGSGKTTSIAKLARFLKEDQKKKVLVVSADVYRPAAIDQLEVVAKQVEVPIFSDVEEKNPVKIALNSLSFAKKQGCDTIIIDTAGRLAIDDVLMKEIENIHAAVNPSETLFVVDSMTGQDAVNTAKSFNEILNFDGVVLTKLDGDSRGGAALSIKTIVNKPIKFIGTGEKMSALDVFHPDRMADRILGMGDVVSLVERAQEQFDIEQAKKINKKIAKNKFGFDDFLSQIQQVKKMGDMKDLVKMIPGIGNKMKDVDIDESSFKNIEVIIGSMTNKEKQNPNILDHSRKIRIAKGSGRGMDEVNQLIKQFNQMNKMMKMMQSGKGQHLMQMFQGMK